MLHPRRLALAVLPVGLALFAAVWILRRPSPAPPVYHVERPVAAPVPRSRGGVPPPPAPPSAAPPQAQPSAAPSLVPAGSPRSPVRGDVEALTRRALDVQAAPLDRVKAAGRLRSNGFGASMGEVLDAMALLLRSSPEEAVRLEICKELRGTDSPEWRRQLLSSVQTEPSVRVRAEAAGALIGLPLDPAQRQLLEQAEAREADPAVKKELQRAIRRPR